MKKHALLLGLSLLSSSVLANTYNNQVDFNYLNVDDFNVINLEGTHYFDSVTTNNTAWAEAAFMGRNNSVTAGYTNFDSDAYSLALGGDYYHENIFVGVDFSFVLTLVSRLLKPINNSTNCDFVDSTTALLLLFMRIFSFGNSSFPIFFIRVYVIEVMLN